MRIEQLRLRNFRNLRQVDFNCRDSRCIVLQGDNAQGKTNILEAMFLVATGRSFRLASPEQMVHRDAATARIEATLCRQDVRHQVDITLAAKTRRIEVDGRSLSRATKLLEMVNMVAFFPDDLRLVKGSPEERRRFVDRATANFSPPFVDAALAYHKTLRARNALLKAPARPDRDLIAVYDTQLAHAGSIVHHARLKLLAALQPLVQRYFCRLLPRTRRLILQLEAGFELDPAGMDDTEGTRVQLLGALQRSFGLDCARKVTGIGPHRADVRLLCDGEEMRLFASQGQMRSLVLALKLAEVMALREQLGAPPILLLDDVSSELDAGRTRCLFEVVEEARSQVWVSTTGQVALPTGQGTTHFLVSLGEVRDAA